MNHLTKIFSSIAMCSLCITNAQALLSNTIKDPCNQIPGKWSGYRQTYFCRYEGELEGTLVNNVFELKGDMRSVVSRPEFCSELIHFTITGTCNNGKISGDYKGSIDEFNIDITGPLERVFLIKE